MDRQRIQMASRCSDRERGLRIPILPSTSSAIGGADRVAKLTSYTATGTYIGFNTGGATVPIEIFAKAPD